MFLDDVGLVAEAPDSGPHLNLNLPMVLIPVSRLDTNIYDVHKELTGKLNSRVIRRLGQV
eukprot:3088610-Pyramimonas_sp.AAC.1